MFSEGKITVAFMVREPQVREKKLLSIVDASLMMLWHEMAHVEMHVIQDFKKEL